MRLLVYCVRVVVAGQSCLSLHSPGRQARPHLILGAEAQIVVAVLGLVLAYQRVQQNHQTE